MYPEPNGREYSEQDLEKQSVVEEIFDYCQIYLAIISKEGWKKLIEFHGINNLLEVDRKSGWFEENRQDAIDSIKYQCLISGYDPERDLFGEYNEDSGIFTDIYGETIEIKWGVNWKPATEQQL